MKKNILKSIAFGVLAMGTTQAMAQSPTAPAQGFNVFVEGGARLETNETDGPFACGGNLTIAGTYQVSTNYTGDFMVGGVHTTLVVGGRVVYTSGSLTVNQNGYVKIGDCTGSTVWYVDNSGAYSPMHITSGSCYCSSPRINLQAASNTLGVSASVNPVCEGGLIDFASALAQMQSSSTCMATLLDNADLTNAGGTPIPHSGLPSQVKITLHTGLNVLNVTGDDLSYVTDFTFNNAPDADHVLLVNVTTPESFTWSVGNSAGSVGLTQSKYVIYNFPNATDLTIGGWGAIEGTLFAPFADIVKTTNSANIEGQVIGQSFWHAGGEVHYAVFQPTITGCSGVAATAANFSVNNSNQCLGGNAFVMTNSTVGTPTITYAWSFGDGTTSTATNPVKTYAATGTYIIKLVATGPGGVDSVTRTVYVNDAPVHDFTVNVPTQMVDTNHFVFTSTAPTTGNTYYWSFGDGTTSTEANPTKTYSASGYYLVGQTVTGGAGCSVYTCVTVVVTCSGVGGGGGGGLESESLGDLVMKREYNKIKNNISSKTDYNLLPVFHQPAFAVAKTTAGSTTLQRLVPAALDAATTPKISTPADITTITSAVDVFSVDYTQSNEAKAVVLGITTRDKAYNHTKSICDRFRGATLISTSIVNIQGFNFIQFVLRKRDNSVEYCIAFTAGKSPSSSVFNLQSKWLISEYSGSDSVFNFQVWATRPDNTIKLASDILNNLKTIMPLQQTDVDFKLPPAYVAYGKRDKGNLDVAITSVRRSGNARIVFIQKINENANVDSLIIPFYLNAGTENYFSLPVADGYEYEGHFFLDDTLTDDTYMADGGWSYDIDGTYTTVSNFKPNNNPNRVYVDGELPVYRSIQMNATTTDYISIYKFITSGQETVDLTPYHSFKFTASGNGTAQVRLIRDSVVNFNDQYKVDVKMDPNGKSYVIPFEDFTSDNLTAPFNAKDVKAVVFTFIMNGAATDFAFHADELSFSPVAVPSVKALQSKAVSVFPNPTSGTFAAKFVSDDDRDMDVVITDISGKLVHKATVHATLGQNNITINLPASVPHSMLMMRIGNKDVHYDVVKINVAH